MPVESSGGYRGDMLRMPAAARDPVPALSQTGEQARHVEERLLLLIVQVPEMQACVTQTAVQNAKQVYGRLPQILEENPHFVPELLEAHKHDPGELNMLVVPSQPLVLATSDGTVITALAPVLGCTLQAIHDFSADARSRGKPQTIASDDGLSEAAWHRAEYQPGRLLKYDDILMPPEDYIALAVTTFYNETFRRRLTQREISPQA